MQRKEILLWILCCLQILGLHQIYGANNVYNEPLEICGTSPITGWHRSGFCTTSESDYGTHVVCSRVTNDFLLYSKSMGNDLITSRGSFTGLKEGNFWCLCVSRK